MGNFGFFQLIKNNAETTLLIDEKYISQEASFTAQQSSRKVEFAKIRVNCLKFVLKQKFWILHKKITFLDYQAKLFSLIQVFGD